MKKLINDPADVVRQELQGMEAAHPDLITVTYDPYTIVREDAPVQGKVALVSGGGSGHEPMHGGFVGMGMLDAACPGEVFTSPTPDQMEAATKAVNGGAGVIHIVKNYTGRRHELRDGGRAVPLPRASTSSPCWSTTTSPCRTASTRPDVEASARPSCWRRSPARRPRRSAPSRRSPTSAAR